MFKLAPINFTENPYICIRIWEWCPASCDSCKISIKNFLNPKAYSLDKIFKVIDESDKKFDKWFDFVFWNLNWWSHPNIIKILEYGISKWRKVRFQLNYNLTPWEIKLLKLIEEKLWSENIYIKIAKNCKSNSDWSKELFLLIKALRSFSNFKFYIDVFLLIPENIKIIETFMKYSTSKDRDHKYNLVIWDSIDVKFHDYSWKINDKDKTIDNLNWRDNCQHLDQVYCDAWDIFIKDSVDVMVDGDIFIHDNLCNIWDLIVSNIFLDNNSIYNNFRDYLSYMDKLSSSFSCQSDACYACIKKGYNYLKCS